MDICEEKQSGRHYGDEVRKLVTVVERGTNLPGFSSNPVDDLWILYF